MLVSFFVWLGDQRTVIFQFPDLYCRENEEYPLLTSQPLLKLNL